MNTLMSMDWLRRDGFRVMREKARMAKANMMTTQDIILKLFSPITKEQLKKAKGYCVRHQIDWALVLADMTDEQKKAVEEAERA